MKSLLPVKAQELETDELQAWFEGRTSRRLLAIPFGGPIPSDKAPRGMDLQGEWFSERTDIYGKYPALRKTRERFVDFHHSFDPPGPGLGDPSKMMSGHLLGKSILDPDPDEDGWWVDMWLKAGEKRVKLVQRLAQRGAQLFGSSQAVSQKTDKATGEILEWPYYLQTISTSPVNTLSVFAPSKAALDELDASDMLRNIISDMVNLGADLDATSRGAGSQMAKAGRELSALNDAEITAAIEEAESGLRRLAGFLDRIRTKYAKHEENDYVS